VSFVIWYKVEIFDAASVGEPASPAGSGLPVIVSNDVFAGSLVLDADVKVTMAEGPAADTFEVTLINLPARTTELIRASQARGPLGVAIHLGYFDEPLTRTGDGGQVVRGRITQVSGCVGDDGLGRTVLYGQESAAYTLLQTPARASLEGRVTLDNYVKTLLEPTNVPLAAHSELDGSVDDHTVRAKSTMDALAAVAVLGRSPLVVRDGTVYLGRAVGAADDAAPVPFDPDVNIVSLVPRNAEDTGGAGTDVRDTVRLTVLGHPRLRVGQVATIKGLTDVPAGPLRIARVEHRFGTARGYTAELELISAGPGQRAQVTTGVQGSVNRMRDVVDRALENHPAIDVGEVTEYTPGADDGHTASMHYAQNPEPTVLTPSVSSPVSTDADLLRIPIASVFAFDRTGLVVPIYPRMRALLAHNRGLVHDAVVAGFVWPSNPATRRPANLTGDYWLALPTRLDGDGLPTGPGVNDLTDVTGHRVIQAAGLHILVGPDALPDVGTRPDPPTDSSITIEHQSGTTIAIDADGAVTVTTRQQAITLTNGSVSLKLDGASVAVS
jgi:hypothetical protein